MVAPVSVARVVVVPEDLPNLLAFPPSLLLTKRVIVEDWAETLPRARVAKIARVKVMFMIASVKGRRCEEFVRRDLEARLTELLSTYNFVTVVQLHLTVPSSCVYRLQCIYHTNIASTDHRFEHRECNYLQGVSIQLSQQPETPY